MFRNTVFYLYMKIPVETIPTTLDQENTILVADQSRFVVKPTKTKLPKKVSAEPTESKLPKIIPPEQTETKLPQEIFAETTEAKLPKETAQSTESKLPENICAEPTETKLPKKTSVENGIRRKTVKRDDISRTLELEAMRTKNYELTV